eukprot:5283121-Amphidinium_carterae.1
MKHEMQHTSVFRSDSPTYAPGGASSWTTCSSNVTETTWTATRLAQRVFNFAAAQALRGELVSCRLSSTECN